MHFVKMSHTFLYYKILLPKRWIRSYFIYYLSYKHFKNIKYCKKCNIHYAKNFNWQHQMRDEPKKLRREKLTATVTYSFVKAA